METTISQTHQQRVRQGIRLGALSALLCSFVWTIWLLIIRNAQSANYYMELIQIDLASVIINDAVFILLGTFISTIVSIIPGIVIGGILGWLVSIMLTKGNISYATGPFIGMLVGIFSGFGFMWLAKTLIDYLFEPESWDQLSSYELIPIIILTAAAGGWIGKKLAQVQPS